MGAAVCVHLRLLQLAGIVGLVDLMINAQFAARGRTL
jgi:hypothetical protein